MATPKRFQMGLKEPRMYIKRQDGRELDINDCKELFMAFILDRESRHSAPHSEFTQEMFNDTVDLITIHTKHVEKFFLNKACVLEYWRLYKSHPRQIDKALVRSTVTGELAEFVKRVLTFDFPDAVNKMVDKTFSLANRGFDYYLFLNIIKGVFDGGFNWGRVAVTFQYAYLMHEKISISLAKEIDHATKNPEDLAHKLEIRANLVQYFARLLVEEEVCLWMADPSRFAELRSLKSSPEYIQAYKRARQQGTKKMYRARVMIVGQHGVGKTSLRKRLLDEGFTSKHQITDGIEMDPSACLVDIKDSVLWHTKAKGYRPEVDNEKPGDVYREEVAKAVLEQIKQGSSVDPPNFPQQLQTDIIKEQHSSGAGDQEIFDDKSSSQQDSKYSVDSASPIPPESPIASLPLDINLALTDLTQAMQSKQEIRSEDVSPEDFKQPKLKLSIWDFGGQSVFYTTHQTFMTSRAIYILVIDLTRGLDVEVETVRQGRLGRVVDTSAPKTGREYLTYWLNSIHTHAAKSFDSKCRLLSPPVIIVCTHKDKVDQIFLKSQSYSKQMWARISGTAYYSDDPNSISQEIRDYFVSVEQHLKDKVFQDHVYPRYFAIDNKNSGDPSLDQLRATILELAKDYAYWGTEIPINWLSLENDVKSLAVETKSAEKFVTLDDVLDIGKNISMNRNDVESCLMFYHDLGEMIFFNEENLKDLVILDPQWLVDAFKSFITIQDFQKEYLGDSVNAKRYWDILDTKGILNEELVDLVWESQPYLKANKQILLQLMMKFDLICELPQMNPVSGQSSLKTYFVPCLLSKPQEEDYIPVKDNDPPPLCYKFKFLPNGLYDRLIACAAQKSEWSVYGNMLFHGYARFELDKAHVLTFTREKESIVTQIHVFLPSPDETRTRSICVKTKKDINDILTMQIKKYCPQVTFDLCVTCDCKAGDPALIDIGVSEFDMILGEAIVCKVHHKSISTAPYGIWYKTFGEEKAEDSVDLVIPEVQLPPDKEDDWSENEDEVRVKECSDAFYKLYAHNTEEVYKNTSKPRGRCIIINNKVFTGGLSNRAGTEKDLDALEALFDSLQYRVVIYHNVTQQSLRETLYAESQHKNLKTSDSLVLIILSHGARSAVFGTDGGQVSYDEIMEFFNGKNCSDMLGKPKLIFIQACQGTSTDAGVRPPTEEPAIILPVTNVLNISDAPGPVSEEVHPTMADILIAKATTPDYVSWRNKEKGTWFVQAIVHIFCRHSYKEDVVSLFTKVNAFVAKQKTGKGLRQVSSIEHTLVKKLYFFPGR